MIKNKFLVKKTSMSKVFLILRSILRRTDGNNFLCYDFNDPHIDMYVRKHTLAPKFSSKVYFVIMILSSITGITVAEALIVRSNGFMTFFVGLITIFNQSLSVAVVNLLFIYFMIFIIYVLTTLFYSNLAILPQNISQHRALMTGIEMIKE